MSLYINHNLMAANAARNLSNIYSNLSTSVQRLSSGLRINSAADDAAGLAVRELMRADIAVINQGIRNASDAISMIQTAEGAMSVIDEKLIRMKELAEQAATGTYTTAQRLIMDSEYQAMAAEIDRIASATDFNGIKLLDGSMATQHDGSGLKVHFGTGNDSAEDYYFVSIGDMKATSITGLQVGGGADTFGTVFRTTGLNMTDTDTDTMDSAGTFGIQIYDTAMSSWRRYGFLDIDTSDTLDDIVAKINNADGTSRGAAAITQLMFTGCTSVNLNNDTITVNGLTLTFSTAISGATTSTIGMAGLSLASITANVQYAINLNHTTTSTIGGLVTRWDLAPEYMDVHSVDFGASTLSISSTNTTIFIAAAIGGGGFDYITASAVADPDNAGEYELQLTADSGQQIRIFQTNGEIFDSTSDGGSPTGGTTLSALALATGSGAYVTDWSDGDDTSEWYSRLTSGPGWNGGDIQTQSAAQLALAAIDDAINRKDTARASLGALQNRLENTITNLQIQAENLQASESRISDVDVALEMTEFTRNNIMTQAAVSMLAQANSLPQLALQLLG